MALSPLTISVTSGVQGRSFKSAVSGFAAGNVVEVLPGGSWGFGYSNGFLIHNGLPADTNLAILRERNPVTGENLTTNLIITAAGAYAVAQKASALDATYKTYRIAPVTQGDGSQIWNVFTEGQTGAVQNTPVNGAAAPSNTVLPAITGTAQVGQTLSVSDGTWTGSPTFAYQWKSNATNVGTNVNTYVPVSGDIGNVITCVVTATNAGGSTPATSAGTAAVIAASLAAPTGTVTVDAVQTWLKPGMPVQRDTLTGGGSGKGQGAIQLHVTAATVGTIHARFSSAPGGGGDYQSEWLACTITATGAQTITISGIDADERWGYCDIVDANGVQNGSILFGVGNVSMLNGQSLAATGFKKWSDTTTLAALGITPNPFTRVFASYQTPGLTYPTGFAVASISWEQPSDSGNYDSAFATTWLDAKQQESRVVEGLMGHAVTSTELSYWQPSWTGFVQLALVAAAAGGKWSTHILDHGHASANITLPATNYQADVIYHMTNVQLLNGYAGAVKEIITTLPNVRSTGFGPMRALNDIRKGGQAAAAARSAVFWTMIDLTEVDFIHGSQAGNAAKGAGGDRARRGVNDGPVLVSATRVTATTTLLTFSDGPITQTGNWKDRVLLYVKGSTQNKWICSAGVISNAVPTAPTALMTHLDPGPGADLDCMWAPPYDGDTSTSAADMLRKGLLHVQPNLVPVTAAALVGAGAVNTPGGAAGPSSLFDMTVTGFSSGSEVLTGFGPVMTAGIAVPVQASHVPRPFPYKMRGYFVCPTTVTATAVIDSISGNDYVAINSSKKMTIGYTKPGGAFAGGTGTFQLVSGTLYWYEYINDLNGVRLYIWDVLSGSVIRDINITSPAPAPHGSVGNWQIGELAGGFKFFTNSSGGSIFELSKWNIAGPTGTTFAGPTAPLVGNETGILSLQRLNTSSFLDVVRFA